MPDEITTKADLEGAFERAWRDLQRLIDAADPDEMMTKADAAGWTTRDHLAHLAAWANSVIVMVRDGRPQWEGLGVSRQLYETDDIDRINAGVREQTLDWPLNRAREALAANHGELVRLVAGMPEEDLQRPCSAYVAGGQDFAIIHKIAGNGPEHYDEHRPWIERILAS